MSAGSSERVGIRASRTSTGITVASLSSAISTS
jgi:hypothetical protein